ncbi:MAG: hypothetical protein LBI60_02295, partial [Bacteroidales bacterium]|nr:hypothetical protein [Bacteroidales bacterium]
ESAGLNIAAYFSEEEWNKCSDSRTLTSSACSGFREDYNRFLHDVFEKQKKQDPIFSGNVVDEAWASTKEKLKEEAIIRAQGAMQMIGGASDIVGGYAIATGGEIFVPGVSAMAGTIVAVNGADNFRAGMYQFFTGYKSKTLASAIESRFRLPQNSINNATAILSLGASAYSFSKSVIKYSAKPRINATVFPSNRAVVEGVRRSSTTMGGKIITPGRTGLQTGKMMGMQSLSPIRQSAKHTKDITSFQNETGITLRQAIDTRIAENAKTVQTAADKNGISNYPDVDDWIAGRIPAGTKIYTALPGGDGNFYAIIDDNINTVQMYRDRLQIMPPDATKGHGERFIIGGYKVTKDIDVAVSRALANPQYGQGGGWQLYLGPNDVRTSLRVDIVDPKLLQK